MGIPEGEEERFFQEFHRGSQEGRSAGTGLGLALTRRIVGLHGGEIWAQRNPGGGSTFSFTMPEAKATISEDGLRRETMLPRMAMFCSRLSAIIDANIEDPPYDTSGSGTPVTGMMPRHMPMFWKVWKANQQAMPAVSPGRTCRRRAGR